MSALRHDVHDDDTVETPKTVVARIKASGHGHTLPVPPADAVSQFVARVASEPSMSQDDEAAWNLAWTRVIDDMQQRDRKQYVM